GVDFNDAVIRPHRFGYVVEDQINPAHIQPDNSRSAFAHRGDLWMNKIGHVSGRPAGREVGAFAQKDDLIRSRHVVDSQITPPHQFHHHWINRDFGERPFVVLAARGMAIGGFHQFRDRAPAVTDDVGWDALTRRRYFPIDYQHAVIATHELLLDYDFRRVLFRYVVCLLDLRRSSEIERNAFPLAHIVR